MGARSAECDGFAARYAHACARVMGFGLARGMRHVTIAVPCCWSSAGSAISFSGSSTASSSHLDRCRLWLLAGPGVSSDRAHVRARHGVRAARCLSRPRIQVQVRGSAACASIDVSPDASPLCSCVAQPRTSGRLIVLRACGSDRSADDRCPCPTRPVPHMACLDASLHHILGVRVSSTGAQVRRVACTPNTPNVGFRSAVRSVNHLCGYRGNSAGNLTNS